MTDSTITGKGIVVKGLAPLLQVFDMPRSIHFYRDLIGFELVGSAPNNPSQEDHFEWALLRLNGVELMLNTAYEQQDRPPAPDPARIFAHQDTAIYFGCPDVDATYEILRSRKPDLEKPTIAHYGMKQLYVTDPDGFVLCFQWPAQ